MKITDSKVNGRRYRIEHFTSVLEVKKVNETREVKQSWIDASAVTTDEVIKRDNDFYRVNSKEEAYNYLSKGWSEGLKEVVDSVDVMVKTGTKSRNQFYNNVYGFAPVVPLAIMNIPNSMIDTRKTECKSKVVTLIYDHCALGCVSSDSLKKASLNVLETVIELEKKGYRVELKIGRFNFDRNNKTCNALVVDVKSANQPINLRKIMFPIAHPAWFRVVSWDWQEKAIEYVKGHGCSYYQAVNEGKARYDDFEKVLPKNTFYINYEFAKLGTKHLLSLIGDKK